MTQSPNSPKAQEVKAVKACPFCGTNRTYLAEWDEYQKSELTIPACEIQCDCGARSPRGYGYTAKIMAIELWNRRVPNENQPPLADKTPTTPQLSGQSEGNREKEALEWAGLNVCGIAHHCGDFWVRNKEERDIGKGRSLLEAIQNAMNSQGGAS